MMICLSCLLLTPAEVNFLSSSFALCKSPPCSYPEVARFSLRICFRDGFLRSVQTTNFGLENAEGILFIYFFAIRFASCLTIWLLSSLFVVVVSHWLKRWPNDWKVLSSPSCRCWALGQGP